MRDEFLMKRAQTVLLNPSDDHVLIDGGPDVAIGIAFGQIGNHPHLFARQIAHR